MSRTLLNHGGIKANQLYDFLGKFTPEERTKLELYIRVAPKGQAFNIKTLGEVVEDSYGFFGVDVPCLILHINDFAPPEPEEEEEEEVSPRLALCQVWTESEKGWGQRPDGYSLHLTKEALERYVRENWSQYPEPKGSPPDEYSFPDGEPFLVEVDNNTYKKVQEATNGIRQSGTTPSRYVPTEK